MSNIFNQPKALGKLVFDTYFANIETFEAILPEDIAGISTYEIKSETVESKPDDLWRIEILVGDATNVNLLKESLQELAHKSNLYIANDISFEPIEEKDWVAEYQSQIKPLIIDKFFITNQSLINTCPKHLVPICIESSRAFGTGEHETTTGCMQAMALLQQEEIGSIFDLGTGTGILSFAAEKIWPKAEIAACDIDEVSVMVANNNKQFNNSAITFFQNYPDDLNLPTNFTNKFDLIVSNILAGPLIELASTIKSLSKNGSHVVLSGFLDYQTESVKLKYQELGMEMYKQISMNKWVTMMLKVKTN